MACSMRVKITAVVAAGVLIAFTAGMQPRERGVYLI
jgi:hypothetical protein